MCYMLMSEVGKEEAIPENVGEEPSTYVNTKTKVRFADDECLWRVRKMDLNKYPKLVYLTLKPYQHSKTSKKTKVQFLSIPKEGFSVLDEDHREITYQDNLGILRKLILTSKPSNKKTESVVEEIFVVKIPNNWG